MTTDDEIQNLIEDDEAGVADLLEAYEPAERRYFSALTPPPDQITYGSNTSPW